MLRIKFFTMTVVLGLAGAVYAAGRMQDAAHQNHAAQRSAGAAACCQAKPGKEGRKAAPMSCDKDGAGCCEGHRADAAGQTAAGREGESCCAGGDCCKGGGCCKGHKKEGAEAEAVKVSDARPAESCCAEGAECCKSRRETAGEKHEGGGCACCGTSCAVDAGR